MVTVNAESRGFKIAVLIGSIIAAIVFLVNTIYYGRLRKNSGAISTNEATTLMIINLILLIVSLIVVIWATYVLVFSPESRSFMQTTVFTKVGQTASSAASSASDWMGQTGGGINIATQPNNIPMVPLSSTPTLVTSSTNEYGNA